MKIEAKKNSHREKNILQTAKISWVEWNVSNRGVFKKMFREAKEIIFL